MINQFEENARPPQIRKLLGTRDEWRIRVGDYRVLLEIDDRNKKVVIYRILHRKEAYRKQFGHKDSEPSKPSSGSDLENGSPNASHFFCMAASLVGQE